MANTPKSKAVVCTIGVAGLLGLAGTAFGQNCANGVNPTQCTPVGNCNGADVIVGDVTGPANYNANGALEAFSLGTTSCNIGNVWLNWFDSTNQHPVIGGGLYRLTTTAGQPSRFEQLGISWLKHGFFALSEGLCCAGCQSTNGQHLGVHCSDPYTATRNGSQSGLGPRQQVNASTGVFTYPPANPAWSGSTARRLQVEIAELVASSATVRYFGAAQYVTNDDAANGNKYNNESYRAANLTGSGTAWSLALTGTTQRTRQGIRAWGDNVSGVNYSDIFIPGDGLVIVAGKATDLGGGNWNYSYCVQNMNSDRCVQGVSVPVPPGVTVSNIRFHDIGYRDGDGPGNVNYSGTDWATNLSNGAVSTGTMDWSTQTFIQNASANAIRWGTMYSYSFDANAAPVAGGGALNLTLFKPGTPTVVQTSRMEVPGTPPPPVCPCDYNHAGGLNSQDFFDFLGDFLNTLPGADYNGDGTINTQDFFDFLGCFLAPPAGCN